MVEVRQYYLPPTALIPNSPRPLLHYPRYFSNQPNMDAIGIANRFQSNGWQVQWIWRYGQTQRSHYHSKAHECMVVLSGSAKIRFGVADTSEDMDENTYGSKREEGGIELEAEAGDVFILPAGTAHKTHDAQPHGELTLLTPGDGHHFAGKTTHEALEEAQGRLSGFTMIGAYPQNGGPWDACTGGENSGLYDTVWAVPTPDNDPVLGDSAEGLKRLWH